MKLPYRLGDSFALPLGNGQFAPSCIVQCEHRVIVIRVAIGEESWIDLRVSDEAFVLHRWKRGNHAAIAPGQEPNPKNTYWMHAERAERIVAGAIGVPHPRERRINVRELRDETAAGVLASLDDDGILTLTHPLSIATLDDLRAALRNHPGSTVRLNGNAASDLKALRDVPLTQLTLAGDVDVLPQMPSLRRLDLLYPHDLAAVAQAFPNLEVLRIAIPGFTVHVQDLAPLSNLRVLDVSGVDIRDAQRLPELMHLAALRLSRITGVRNMDSISQLPLRTLAIEHLYELEHVEALGRISTLQQLELLGLWQLDIAHVEWTLECAPLLRAEIDIGGRRKNIELYRGASWAYPWRFPGTAVR